MRLGALLGPIQNAGESAELANQARQLASAGYNSLWTAQAVGRGFMVTDPFVTLSVAASVTSGLELGTAVLQVPLYRPLELAHRVFSLQQICGDRLLLGVGAGSTAEDFAVFGEDHSKRFTQFNTRIEELRSAFAQGKLGASELSPWPAVLGGPPLLLGSWGNGVVRAAESFSGWIASANYRSTDEIVKAHEHYRQAGGGRAIVSTIMLPPGLDLGALSAQLDTFAESGFDDAVVMFLPGGPDPEQIRALVN
jgi:alkanesulfonate monooxygenase SsuD/methylene tetrahydromethanopterin reductase-like flavin-dependent oxidoreductase (luciferase family)